MEVLQDNTGTLPEDKFFRHDEPNNKEIFSYGKTCRDYHNNVYQYIGEHRKIVDDYEGSNEKHTAQEKEKYELHKAELKRKLQRGGKASLLFLLCECMNYQPPANRVKQGYFPDFILQPAEEIEDYVWGYERCKELETDRNGYGDFWARGHLKTTIITEAMTIQEILIDPTITIGIMSYDDAICKEILSKIRSAIYKLQWIYPDIIPESFMKDKKTNTTKSFMVKTGNDSGRSTVSIISGKGAKTGSHFDLIIYDDLMTHHMIEKPELVEQVVRTFESTVSLNTIKYKGGTKRRFIGTYYSNNDVWAKLEEKGRYTPRIRPCTDNNLASGKLLFFTRSQFIAISDNDLPPAVFQSQYFLRRIGSSEGESLPAFNPLFFDPEEYNQHRLTMYIIVDPAFSITSKSDYTAISVIGIDKFNKQYVYELSRIKIILTDLHYILCQLHEKYNPKATFVEGTAGKELLILKQKMEMEHTYYNITPVSSRLPKNDRIGTLGYQMQSKNIFFKKNINYSYINQGSTRATTTHSSMETLEKEWKAWERSNKHNRDDMLDVLAYPNFIEECIYEPTHTGFGKTSNMHANKVQPLIATNNTRKLASFNGLRLTERKSIW